MSKIQIQYDNEPYVVSSCKDCPKKNTTACNTCSRKRTEAKPKSECHSCSDSVKQPKQTKCNCENTTKNTCSTTRSVCNSNHFVVQNYFSELVHDWERDLAKYNLGIQELESINYFTKETENGSLLNKVQFVFRRGHELITKEFLVAPSGKDGKDGKDGKPFTWQDLSEEQRNMLRGDIGETPILRYVSIDYSDSPCDVNGVFERIGDTLYYDLKLVLPKQKSFDECLQRVEELLNQFYANINTYIIDLINDKINNINTFDFSKLGLSLVNNELTLTYDGRRSNSVTLNIQNQDQYTLKHNIDVNNRWNDTVELLKNNIRVGDVFSPSVYKPKDWWILPYPSVILMSNGKLITKKLRISAWSSESGEPKDMTEYESSMEDKDFLILLQGTFTYTRKYTQNGDVWENHWASLSDRYNKNTGVLTLPENNYFDGEYLFRYTPGGFVTVALYSNDYRPKRYYIPIIDIDNVYGENVIPSSNIPTYTDKDPNDLEQDGITHCYLVYTSEQTYDLSTFYDANDQLIDSWVRVQRGTAEYIVQDNKKYFKGDFIKVNDVETEDSVNFYKFTVDGIRVGEDLNSLVMKFKYDQNTPTAKQMRVLYNQLVNDNNFNKVLTLEPNCSESQNLGDDQFILTDVTNQGLIFTVVEDDTNLLRHLIPSGNLPYQGIQYFDLVLKHSNLNNSNGKFSITYSATDHDWVVTPLTNNPYYYFNLWFNSNYGQIVQTIYYSGSIQPPAGTVLVNNMFFNNGLFIAECSLTSPTISEDGKYAYDDSGESIQIQNLTNETLEIQINDTTYEVSPHSTYTEELQPSEPAGH